LGSAAHPGGTAQAGLYKNDDPSGQSWSTFLRNHAPQIAAMDLFVVATVGFVQLYVLVIVRLARRQLVRQLCCSIVLVVTNRMFARLTASQIASASVASFFCRLT
jgi:hypothetical protein